jgi:hypothetical protein
MVALNGLNYKDRLVGSKSRPTYEKGETSGSVLTRDITGLTGLELKLDKPKDTTSNPWVEDRPEQDSPEMLALSLTSESSGGHVVSEGKVTSHDEVAHHMGWFLQLNDGRRLVIPNFLQQPWSRVGDFLDESTTFMPKLVPRPADIDAGGLEVEITRSKGFPAGLEMVPVQASEPIMVEPLSMICPLLEASHSSGFYQNPPSDWVVGQMKAFGELVGASYEGYEDEVMALLQKIELQRPQQSAKVPS